MEQLASLLQDILRQLKELTEVARECQEHLKEINESIPPRGFA